MFELGDLDRAPSLGGSDQRTEHQLQDGSLAERIRDDLEATASEVTSSGSFRPRLFMSSKNAVTDSASSLEPAIMCSSTRRPSIVKPHAARTGSRLAPGRKRSAMPSTNRYVFSYSLKSRCV